MLGSVADFFISSEQRKGFRLEEMMTSTPPNCRLQMQKFPFFFLLFFFIFVVYYKLKYITFTLDFNLKMFFIYSNSDRNELMFQIHPALTCTVRKH